ncbi:transglycosylase SLT domain-containing protein [Paraburkholderia solisilvae]|uniref:Transglycosylase SLT domain-containing protein n=1 Tax=Paraburkholderia solisilvae TaxID=624376 RepID=A0A6J5DFG1_9BURK|nr:transglycosylase SLT domain-containing protein [Paraburkholderia solisilvae]CAB3752999.1 hypothetical protein LMG29739_01639 [Paraburkholderia solisilvae]
MPDVKIGVSAQLNAQDLDAQLDALKQKINGVGQAIAQANRVQFQPIAKATAQDLERVTKQFEALKRGAPNIRDAIAKSGQGDRQFFDLDWSKIIGNSIAREAARFGAFAKVTAGTGASFAQPAPATPYPSQSSAPGGNSGAPASRSGGGGRHGGSGGYRPGSPGGSWGGWRGFGRQTLGGVVRAGGGAAGAAVTDAMEAGGAAFAAGGLGPAGLIVGGVLAAKAAAAAAAAVRAKIGDAQQEDIGYDTLKRTLGDTNVSFEALKDGLRAAAGSIGVTFNESEKLGQSFAKLGNVSEKNYTELAQEVQFGGGLARSFGLEPSQMVGFMGSMRGLGITHNVQDSERLGMIIGSTIAKSGAFSQADRVLQAIGSYAEQQTRLGLTAANVSGYGGALAGLVSSGVPGLDVAGAASILDRANSAIANGGSAGAAGQNFLYAALGQRLDLDPIQTRLLQEQGAFGTGAKEFGAGSLFSKWAGDNGVTVPRMAAGSTSTNLSMIMSQLRRNYAGGGVMSELRVNAESNLLHLNNSQAMALDFMYGRGGPQNVDSTLQRLQRLGISLNSVNATGISRLAQIDASGDLTPAQKDAQFRAVASQAQEKTPGSDVRDSIVGVQNALQGYADKAVPLLSTSADALLALVGKQAGGMMTPAQLHDAVLAGQRKTINDKADDAISKARGQLTAASAVDDFGRPIDPKGQQAAYDNLQAVTKAANDERTAGLDAIAADDYASRARPGSVPTGIAGLQANKELRDFLGETDSMLHLTPGTSAAIGMQESGLTPWSVGTRNPNGTVDLGEFQINSANLEKLMPAFRKLYGRDPDWQDPLDSARLERMVLQQGGKGSEAHVLGAYNAGPKNADGAQGQAYADSVLNRYLPSIQASGLYDFKMPSDAATSPNPQPQQHVFTGEFTLNYPNGKPAAAPIAVSKQVGPPQPAGTN